jgi:DNA-3-methyladenine glycosylase II
VKTNLDADRSECASIEVRFDGDADLAASLEIFRRAGDDLIDRWDGAWLTRTVRIDGKSVAYTGRASHERGEAVLAVLTENLSHNNAIAQTVARSFLPLSSAFEALCQNDAIIGRVAAMHRGFRPILQPDLFVALIRCISAQQVNLRWAATTRRRLAEKYGTLHTIGDQFVYSLNPERVAGANPADIRALQFTTRKAEYIVNVARAIADGALDIEYLRSLSDGEVITLITKIRGLGVWTGEWILARTLGRPRVSASDLGVRKAVGRVYLNGRMPSPDEVRAATAHWGAAAAFAQELLLHAQYLKTLDRAATLFPAA